MSRVHDLMAWPVRLLVLAAVRAWTGARPLWAGEPPGGRPCVYFANHTSHGDAVLVWATLPAHQRRRLCPVVDAEPGGATALRRFLARCLFAWPRPAGDSGAATLQGHSLLVFPEGCRNTGEQALLPFAAPLYQRRQAHPEMDFVPVWIANMRRVMPPGEWLPLPLACTVSYGVPLVRVDGEDEATFLARAAAAVLALRPEEET
ncbi:lysophospholipid acyltransferase family protein [Eleftheria terrae]|uniref:lysophospholipid acyltransferase family protein n=1 Tax=Eleftheria terrae TaxID=1597781 RepID=UPI00263AD126|nr:lysophospholipid acyltransferase family protein [Eleftheria terrae]WKB53922.1 1-acyl-sn-glycerol-3-phosphate acyltransferase [Eleftheria terrae]